MLVLYWSESLEHNVIFQHFNIESKLTFQNMHNIQETPPSGRTLNNAINSIGIGIVKNLWSALKQTTRAKTENI